MHGLAVAVYEAHSHKLNLEDGENLGSFYYMYAKWLDKHRNNAYPYDIV